MPDKSMFDFSIGEIEGDEASSAIPSSTPLSDDVKEKLQEVLQLLSQDVSILVQDVEPIRNILKQIKAHISYVILETLTPMAFIENQEIQVTKANKRLADRDQNAKLLEENKTHEAQAKELHRRSEVLESSRPDIVAEIDRLTAR